MAHKPRPKYLRFKIVHYYLIPIIALAVWWGMLIAMLACWSIQGHPVYHFMGYTDQDPVYISDIGATNLQPLFIACAGFQAIFFVGTLIMELVLRKMEKLQPYVSTKQPKFAIASIIFAILGQLGILFVSIFNTNEYHRVHISMVGLFIAGSFLACVCNFFITLVFGHYPSRLCPDHEKVIFGKHRYQNIYMVSFVLKVIWLIAAVVLAICFGVYMENNQSDISACFEWSLAFWYGVLLLMWSLDLFPSAVKHYRVRHQEEFEKKHILEDETYDDSTLRTFGSPTYHPNNAHSFV